MLTEDQKNKIKAWWQENWQTTVSECSGSESEAMEYMKMDVWTDVFHVSETDESLSDEWKMDVEQFLDELARV